MIQNKGKLIIISGPSGVGKGTICKELLKNKDLNLELSISVTTREKRQNEIEGKNYFFVSKKEFKKNIKEENLLEYAKFVGNYYGTLKKYCEDKLSKGINLLLEIEIVGAMKIIKKFENIISIFILPPDLNKLKERLINRKTENNKLINKRLKKSKKEIKYISKYKYVVINDNLQLAIKEIENILNKEIEL